METSTYLYILIAAIVSLAIAVFQYFYRVKVTSKTEIILTFLRFLSIFIVLVLLINPKIKTTQLEIEKPKLVVAADNSQSIKHLKQESTVTGIIGSIKTNNSLNDKFDVSYFIFDDGIKTKDSITFDTSVTNISKSITELQELYKENARVILITDGNHTKGNDYTYFKGKNSIYPIIVGDTVQHEDLKISTLNVNRYSFLNNTFPVELFVNYNGNSTINTTLSVFKGKTVVFRKIIQLSPNNNSEKIVFKLSGNKVGSQRYSAQLTKIVNEKNTVNNQKSFSVQIIDEQAKIAIVSDMLHPDLGAIKRAIESNKQRTATIIKPSQVKDFDSYQLFILYQPNATFKSLFETIAKTNSNSITICGTQTDWNFLNKSQNNFSKSIINQNEAYFAVKNPSYTPFVTDDLSFENLPPLNSKFGDITFSIAHETLLFQSINGIQIDKPLLATYANNDIRGAILDGEDLWKWRVYDHANSSTNDAFDTFVNKLVQYLTVKKNLDRLHLTFEPILYKNDAFIINATYFDNNYEIDTRAKLNLTIRNTNTNEVKNYPFRLAQDQYESATSNLQEGEYSFTVSNGGDVKKSGSFSVLDYNIEQQFTFANVKALQSLAEISNGKAYHSSNFETLLQVLDNDDTIKPIQKSITKEQSLLDWRWLLAMIAVSLGLEWFIRKYYGKI